MTGEIGFCAGRCSRSAASGCRSTDRYGLARVAQPRQNKQVDEEFGDDFRRAVAVDHVRSPHTRRAYAGAL